MPHSAAGLVLRPVALQTATTTRGFPAQPGRPLIRPGRRTTVPVEGGYGASPPLSRSTITRPRDVLGCTVPRTPEPHPALTSWRSPDASKRRFKRSGRKSKVTSDPGCRTRTGRPSAAALSMAASSERPTKSLNHVLSKWSHALSPTGSSTRPLSQRTGPAHGHPALRATSRSRRWRGLRGPPGPADTSSSSVPDSTTDAGTHPDEPAPLPHVVPDHIRALSTSTSQPGANGSNPCSTSHRMADKLRNDHQPRTTSTSTGRP